MTFYGHELAVAEALAREAGALLLLHRRAGLKVDYKTSRDDPVTLADREASRFIADGLKRAFPADGLLSEEETDAPDRRVGLERVWIIDPIDGTQEFTEGSPDFCVSIGLCVGGEAVLGAVYAPDTDELFSGYVGAGVRKNSRPVGFADRADYVVSVSNTEFKRELHRYGLSGLAPSGSIALKLARLAAGEADVTFTISPRSEWDIAAGDALVRASGGVLRRRDGRAIRYNLHRPQIEQGIIGGRLDAVAWLEHELNAKEVPTAHLGVQPGDPAWVALSPADQAQLNGQPGVCIRYAGGRMLALLHVDPPTRTVLRSEGDAFHLARLTRDVTRSLGSPLGSLVHGPLIEGTGGA